jgi:hypothetical protein
MAKVPGGRCRRCGADADAAGEPFAHHLFLLGEDGGEVILALCRPCGNDFATVRDRDEYVRLSYLG